MKTCPSCNTTYEENDNYCSRLECGGAELRVVSPAVPDAVPVNCEGRSVFGSVNSGLGETGNINAAASEPMQTASPGEFDRLPIRFEVNPGTNPAPGCPAVLECRLTNLSDQTLAAEIRLQTDDDVTVLRGGEPVRLSAGHSSPPVPLRFRPESSGHFNLTVLIEIGERGWFESRIKYEVAQISDRSPNNINIDAFNPKGHEGRITPGDVIAKGTINVYAPDKKEAKPVQSHEWTEAALFESGGPKQTLDRVRPRQTEQTNRLTLTLRLPGQPPSDVCLSAGNETCFGKERDGINRRVDLRLRLAPKDDPERDPNNRLYQQISREHAVIRFESDGPVWQNLNCKNGTVVEGTQLDANASMQLRPGMLIRPADVTGLRVNMARDEHHDAADYRSFVEHRLNAEYRPPVGPVQALRLTRTDSLADVESYIVMQQAFEIGRNRQCALSIDDSSLRTRHARILHLGGWFWIESCEPAALVRYRDRPLPLDTLAPLVPGVELTLGDLEIEVSAFEQHVLDCDCPEHDWA
ncbi:MAG: FHA domain-containing protein [Rhodopirellula sp.]|nr:FHA domain-containing protein [Rhodopirellula sp.]